MAKKDPPTEAEMKAVFNDYPCYGCEKKTQHCQNADCQIWREWFHEKWQTEKLRLLKLGGKR